MICPNCGANLNEETPFCTSCGAKLATEPAPVLEPEVKPAPPVMEYANVCMQCGTPRTGEEQFCTNCGASLKLIQPVAPAEAPAQPQPAIEIPVQPQAAVGIQAQPIPQPMPVQEEPRPAAPIYAEPSVGVKPNFQAAPANLKEFVLQFGDDKTQKVMKGASIAMYVLAALNLIFALMGGSFPLDAILLAAMGFWYQKTYSNTAAIVFLAYAILTIVLSLVINGEFTGWLILIIAVLVFTTTQKASKSFKAFLENGQIPMQ